MELIEQLSPLTQLPPITLTGCILDLLLDLLVALKTRSVHTLSIDN